MAAAKIKRKRGSGVMNFYSLTPSSATPNGRPSSGVMWTERKDGREKVTRGGYGLAAAPCSAVFETIELFLISRRAVKRDIVVPLLFNKINETENPKRKAIGTSLEAFLENQEIEKAISDTIVAGKDVQNIVFCIERAF